jgi:hypothetical protein
VEYYRAFDEPKIVWPDISKFPRFSWDTAGLYLGNTGYIMPTNEPWLLGFLNSRCAWFLISNIAVSLGERAGSNRYRLIDQYMRPLPTPNPALSQRDTIGKLALEITERAKARYDLHSRTRRRILADLGTQGRGLNQKLTAWWGLDFAALRAELQKVFKRDIPVKARDEWEEWFAQQKTTHGRLTSEIVRLETDLNACVYSLFRLSPAEIELIERETKYHFGEL